MLFCWLVNCARRRVLIREIKVGNSALIRKIARVRMVIAQISGLMSATGIAPIHFQRINSTAIARRATT